MGSIKHFAKHFHQHQSPNMGPFSCCIHPVLALPTSQRDLADFRGAWAETCQEKFFCLFVNLAFKLGANHLLQCAGAVISTPARQRLRWGDESFRAEESLRMNVLCQNMSSFVLSQQDCELTYLPTKACKGFVAECFCSAIWVPVPERGFG